MLPSLMLMRIALPIWDERISPVFDVAAQVLLVDVDRQAVTGRREHRLAETDPMARVETLISWGVDVLICGAISRAIEQLLRARQVEVICRICGSAEEVLEAYLAGDLEAPRFRLPGCESPGRGGGRGRGGRGAGGGRGVRGRRRGAAAGDGRPEAATCCEDIVVSEQDIATVSRRDDSLPGEDGLTRHEPDEVRSWIARVGDDIAGSLVLRRRGDVGRISELSIPPGWSDGPVPCRLVQKALSYCRARGLLKVELEAPGQSQRMLWLFRCLGFQAGRRRRQRGQGRPMEFYLDLYRRVDEARCAEEADDLPTEPQEG